MKFPAENLSYSLLTMTLPSGYATDLLNSRKSDELHSARRTPAPSETQSEVHSEGDGICSRLAYRPIETDWQVCLNEVTFKEAAFPLNGPAVVQERRKSPRRGIYVKRRSHPHRPAVSHTPEKPWCNSESSCVCTRCIYKRVQFEVEGGAAASFDGDSHGESNRKLICQTGGLASGGRHQRKDEADMPAQSYAILSCAILRLRHSARQGRRQRCQYNPCSSHFFSILPL